MATEELLIYCSIQKRHGRRREDGSSERELNVKIEKVNLQFPVGIPCDVVHFLTCNIQKNACKNEHNFCCWNKTTEATNRSDWHYRDREGNYNWN